MFEKITNLYGMTLIVIASVIAIGARRYPGGIHLRVGGMSRRVEVFANRRCEGLSRSFVVRLESQFTGNPIFYVTFPIYGPRLICRVFGHTYRCGWHREEG